MASSNSNKILWILAVFSIVGVGATYLVKENIKNEYDSIAQEYEARPGMPVEISYRSALLGPGLVISMKNKSTRHLSLVATFLNPTLNKEEVYRIDVSPNEVKEIGHAEGWVFSSGDVIKISHKDYKGVTQKLP